LHWAIGIDLGGTSIKAAAVDEKGRLIFRLRVPTLAKQGMRAVLDQLVTLINELSQKVQVGPLAGIGIGVPGTVDKARGVVVLAPNLNWRAVPLQDLLAEKYSLQVVMENDTQAAAIGEQWTGGGKGVQHMLMVTIGTGIGSGLILNGRLHRGYTGRGPELGHTKLPADLGFGCGCGSSGCLETLSSGSAMVRTLAEIWPKTDEESLYKMNFRGVIQRAVTGDPRAEKVIENAMASLAAAIANVSLVLDLELVLVGGGVAEADEYLISPLRKKVSEAMFPYPPPRVMKGTLGNWAGVVGVARLAFFNV